jgi:hypothetical protein
MSRGGAKPGERRGGRQKGTPPMARGEAIRSPIVEHEEIDLDQHSEQAREATVAVGEIKIGEQARTRA